MPNDGADLLTRYGEAFMATYGPPQRVFVKGKGSYVWDVDGKRYLDLLGGIAVNALGHAHPAWVKAVQDQAATLAHVSNFFTTPEQVALAERLLEISGAPEGSKVFLCSTGTEAIEAALKMARRAGKTEFVALEGSFHGRTMGALAVTHKPAAREPYGPLPLETNFVPVNDEAALAAAFTPDTAALVLEPIQGESGVRPLTDAFLAEARRLCDQHGALLIVDEVQTGIARTGVWFAHQSHGFRPDIMALAKGLAGGFPIGAVIAYGPEVAGVFSKGDHGTTFGGNPLACAAALATLDAIEQEGILENVKAVGEHIREVASAIPGVSGVRGEGLMLGLALEKEIAVEAVPAALEAGFIVNAPRPDTIRLIPALNLTAEEADTFLDWLKGYLAKEGT
ncbi:MAG: acetylornithine transaminase [Demequinaceae bacterium]|nr:acetylornithine transaminase [Demequinaceae bacterium]